MKRTPLRRKSPMRSRPMSSSTPKPSKKRKSPKRKTKYAQRERDFDYMGWVKTRPCLLRTIGPCSGVVEADHAGERGLGQKAPDNTCIPLCSSHHLDRHACTGFFRGLPRDWKRRWRRAAIAHTQHRYRRFKGSAVSLAF